MESIGSVLPDKYRLKSILMIETNLLRRFLLDAEPMLLAFFIAQIASGAVDDELNEAVDCHVQCFVSSASKGSCDDIGRLSRVYLVVRDIIPERQEAVCIAKESGALLGAAVHYNSFLPIPVLVLRVYKRNDRQQNENERKKCAKSP